MRNVVVTGGSRGLGLGIARQLAQAGFRSIVIARNRSDDLDRAMQDLPHLCFVPWDLSALQTLSNLAKQVRQIGPVYGLVNNAGFGPAGVLATMSDSVIREIMLLNVISPITLTKYFLKSMLLSKDGGRIVSIASVVAQTGYAGLAPYSASKAALIGFTRSLAREIGPIGITVNAVSPGFVTTQMTHGLNEKQVEKIKRRSALNRMTTVDDVAATVGFLISDQAANITGQVITVDAGSTV
jgi:3-oxoacyl-[acyl-carrier protein] reductase